MYPDIEHMFHLAGFEWDGQANAWRYEGHDAHMPGTIFTYLRPVYVTVHLTTNDPDKLTYGYVGAEAGYQLDQFFTKGLTKTKLGQLRCELAKLVSMAYPYQPEDILDVFMKTIEKELGVA